MGHRVVDIYVPSGHAWTVSEVLTDVAVLGQWRHDSDPDHTLTRLLVDDTQTETVLNKLDERFAEVDGFRVIVQPAEAVLPRPKLEDEVEAGGEEATETAAEEASGPQRISTDELYSDIVDSFSLTEIWVGLVLLSAIVAAIGLLRDSPVIVIGAMVIAPLLGPNVAMALATTLADQVLARKSLKVSAVGVASAFVISAVIGWTIQAGWLPAVGGPLVVDPSIGEIASRTQVNLGDVALALASGAAGALSFTIGLSSALIGVMVAVALLPPLVVSGLLAGAGYTDLAVAAGVLAVVNLICINLAGVVTFAAQGIRPRDRWEAGKARRATALAIVIWVLLLVALVAAIQYQQQGGQWTWPLGWP